MDSLILSAEFTKVSFELHDKKENKEEKEYKMFGKRVNAVIWNDNKNPARGFNKKTRFVANYIFEDGYGALEECKK